MASPKIGPKGVVAMLEGIDKHLSYVDANIDELTARVKTVRVLIWELKEAMNEITGED